MQSFFNAFLAHAVPGEIWPEVKANKDHVRQRFLEHLNKTDSFILVFLKGLMFGLEHFLGLRLFKLRRFSKLSFADQEKTMEWVSNSRFLFLNKLFTFLKLLTYISAYSEKSVLQRLEFFPEDLLKENGCLNDS